MTIREALCLVGGFGSIWLVNTWVAQSCLWVMEIPTETMIDRVGFVTILLVYTVWSMLASALLHKLTE